MLLPRLLISSKNAFFLVVSFILFHIIWMDKITRFIVVAAPLLLFEFDREEVVEHVIFMLILFGLLGLAIYWDWFNDVGHIIFPFIWCMIVIRVYLPTYLAMKYGVNFTMQMEDIVQRNKSDSKCEEIDEDDIETVSTNQHEKYE